MIRARAVSSGTTPRFASVAGKRTFEVCATHSTYSYGTTGVSRGEGLIMTRMSGSSGASVIEALRLDNE